MVNPTPEITDSTGLSSIGPLRDSFLRHLAAENKSPSTRITYQAAIDLFATFVVQQGMPDDVAALRREHVEAFLVDLQARGMRPATVANRYRSLQQFFKWLTEEGELKASPMANMSPPRVPEEPPAVLQPDELKVLLATCSGTDFEQRRDMAIVRLFLDTGMRLGELSGLRLEDVDFTHNVAVVMGKGSRPRAVPFGRRTAQAIDRYLRIRGRHAHRGEAWLWVGKGGRLGYTGVAQVVRRRGKQAGLILHPHLFRHTFAHAMLADGMQEGDLMRLAGWKSRQMLSRYGASAADERARAAFQSHSLGDRV
jgi:site-specific recombinase XerC